MSYTYGVQGFPKKGNGLGGLPKGSSDTSSYDALLVDPTIVDFINGQNGVYTIPPQYKFFRVTAVGAGSSGIYSASTGSSGGGGGTARSAITIISGRTIAINYSAGATTPTNTGGAGADSTAAYLDTTLIGGGAFAHAIGVAGIGGQGSGGVANFKGGNGGSSYPSGGGGAAGTRGNGGNVNTAGTIDGGGGGGSNVSGTFATGGGGIAAPGSSIVPSSGAYGFKSNYWGGTYSGENSTLGAAGGAWGGGGACFSDTSALAGGYGGIRIELW